MSVRGHIDALFEDEDDLTSDLMGITPEQLMVLFSGHHIARINGVVQHESGGAIKKFYRVRTLGTTNGWTHFIVLGTNGRCFVWEFDAKMVDGVFTYDSLRGKCTYFESYFMPGEKNIEKDLALKTRATDEFIARGGGERPEARELAKRLLK
jgi:hypothetical protein